MITPGQQESELSETSEDVVTPALVPLARWLPCRGGGKGLTGAGPGEKGGAVVTVTFRQSAVEMEGQMGRHLCYGLLLSFKK